MRILLALLLCCIALDATAASFPCAKAKSKVEKLVCADPVLSKLDEELAAAYKQAVAEDRGMSLQNGEREWLTHGREDCGDKACLEAAYRQRIVEVRRWREPAAWNDEEMLGNYLEPRRVEFFSADGGTVEDAADCLSITRAPDGKVELRLSSIQVNGHACMVKAEAQREGAGYRTLPTQDSNCRLQVSARSGSLVIEDPEKSCQKSCGARASVEGLSFRHSQRTVGRCQFMNEDL